MFSLSSTNNNRELKRPSVSELLYAKARQGGLSRNKHQVYRERKISENEFECKIKISL